MQLLTNPNLQQVADDFRESVSLSTVVLVARADGVGKHNHVMLKLSARRYSDGVLSEGAAQFLPLVVPRLVINNGCGIHSFLHVLPNARVELPGASRQEAPTSPAGRSAGSRLAPTNCSTLNHPKQKET